MVNVRGELDDNRGRQMIEKRRPSPCIITKDSERETAAMAGDSRNALVQDTQKQVEPPLVVWGGTLRSDDGA